MRFVIVTGMSGAGKSQTIRCLEDFGYYCVDNLPSELIPKFADLCHKSGGKIDKIAVVVDIRGGKFFDKLFTGLQCLDEMHIKYEILFLEAEDSVVIKRFKESRRKHPLSYYHGTIAGAIQEEREKLSEVKNKSNHIIDTSNMSTRQLREEIEKIFIENKDFESMIINVVSFGFKYGIPIDADLVFDVRFLPNPYYVDELKHYTGLEDRIKHYVLSWKEAGDFISKISDLLEFLVPNYIKEGKSQLVIAVGCTGGMHRSVVIAEEIYKNLKSHNHTAIINHRDISNDSAKGGR